jgi:rhodanese-related sulfurtransferase
VFGGKSNREVFRMSETKPDVTKPKKVVGRGVAVALGLICVLLIAGLGVTLAYYTMNNNTLNSKISEINQLNAMIAEQNKQLQMARDGDISVETAYRMVNSGVLVVDVRTPYEYDIMHINNSINIPYYNMTDFATLLYPLAGKQNTQFILYCRTGIRSENAWLYLNSTGYNEIYNMLGGINAWRAMNYTVWEAPSMNISLMEAYWMVELGQGVNGTFPNMVIIDVRDPASYATGHLPNATNIPYINDFDFKNRITTDLAGRNKNYEIVVYCSGNGCELSSMAASVLIENGFTHVYWIPAGYTGWVNAGFPIDTKNETKVY